MFKKPTYKQEVFKFQRPIMTTGSYQNVLAYNKDRSAQGEFPMDRRTRRLFGNDFKIYVRGYMDERGLIHLLDLVPTDQHPDW